MPWRTSTTPYVSWWCRASQWMAAQNFAKMQLSEIRHHITARRNRIFLLMEELRRLRIQQRLKVGQSRNASRLAHLSLVLPV